MRPGGYNNTELITRLVSSSLGESVRVNLPKLQLPVFDGNLQQSQEFWDIYKATIHATADYASSFEVQLFEQSVAERVSIVSHSRNTSYKWELFIGC